jgi:DNA-binding MarR family transcriptional regulator
MFALVGARRVSMPRCVDHHSLPPASLIPEGDEGQESTLETFHALGRLFHLHRQAMQRRLSNPETHHGELISLRLLANTDGISQSELADTLHLSRSRVTSILQRLEKAGAIRRQVDPADQRVYRVFLTPEGARQETEHRAAFEDYVNGTIGVLSETDKRELTRLLNEVSAHIAELVCPTPTEEEGGIAP